MLLLLGWMEQMQIVTTIDQHWQPHREWEGLSYGQLTVLFLAFVLQQREHRLSCFKAWLAAHRHVIQVATGWTVGLKHGTDDRLGSLLETLGGDSERLVSFRHHFGQHFIQAYALPSDVARFDTPPPLTPTKPRPLLVTRNTPFWILALAKISAPTCSSSNRPWVPYDPAGVPLLSETLPGNGSDDPLYILTWHGFVRILGHHAFLFMADAKAESLLTRATIAQRGGFYLFPLPITGDVHTLLRQWVREPPIPIKPLQLPTSASDPTPREDGRGFPTWRQMPETLEDGTAVSWRERWLVSQKSAQAEQQKERLYKHRAKAEVVLAKLKPKSGEQAAWAGCSR